MLKLAKCLIVAAAVLAAGRAWAQADAELSAKMVGGKVEADKTLRVKPNKVGELENVTLAGTVVVDNRGELKIGGALTLDGGKILMASGAETSFETVLTLRKGAGVAGKGIIEFRGGKTRNRVVSSEDKTATVFGPEVTLRGDKGGGQFRSLANAPMRFEGKLIAGGGDETMRFEGPMTIVGTLLVQPGAEAAILDLTNLAAGTLTGGTFALEKATLRVKEAVETNAAKLELQGSILLAGEKGTENVLDQLKKNAAGGEIRLKGTQKFAGGILNEGTLIADDGTILGRLENKGTLRARPLLMDGDLVLGAAGKLVLQLREGAGPGDSVHMVSGKIAAGGTLEVTLAEGFSPAAGSKFALLGGAVEGKFAKFVLPKLAANLGWSVEHLYDQGILEVVAGAGSVPEEKPAVIAPPVETEKAAEKTPEKPGTNWVLYIVFGVLVAVGAAFWGWRRAKRAAK